MGRLDPIAIGTQFDTLIISCRPPRLVRLYLLLHILSRQDFANRGDFYSLVDCIVN